MAGYYDIFVFSVSEGCIVKSAVIVQGYPSIGDVHSTVPVPQEKWYDYAGERSGRFQVRLPFH